MPPTSGPIYRNFGAAAEDYARHRPGFPPRLVAWLQEAGHLPTRKGATEAPPVALDLGTGTGSLARWWARQAFRVHGLDPDARLLAAAAKLDAAEGLSIDYHQGLAEALPFADNRIDLLSAGQCWHWFDPTRATREIRRVLAPQGVVVVAHYDWLPRPGSLAAATEALILKHNPQWTLAGGDGLHPQPGRDLAAAGFHLVDRLIEEVPQPFTPEAWRGRIRASVGIAASLDTASVQAFDRELAALMAKDFPGDHLAIPHLLDITVARLATS